MIYKESHTLELKEQYSDTFLKTVCAFANEGGGKIIFGISDSGKVVGVKDFDSVYPKIEQKIFDLIHPIPYFLMEIDHASRVIVVSIEADDEKPYFYKNKTYIRRGTSTIVADIATQKKLIMEAKGITFEEQNIQNLNLNFKYLSRLAKQFIGIKNVNEDFLKTCGLIDAENKFNNAALLFSDDNNFCGIDTVKYNEVTEKFTLRKNFDKCSILEQVEKALSVFDDVYSYEKIVESKREKFYEVPIKAFREALVNAVIHRDWEIKSNIKITFFEDRVEVLSPGVLPKDISKDEFLNGFVSVPRNYIICSLFRRLGYIERMGYGISLIKKAYRNHAVKPRFDFMDNFINVVLPVVGHSYNLSDDETLILNTLKYSKALSSSQISQLTKISRTKVVALCNSLVSKSLLQKAGNGRGIKYSL